MHRHSFLETDFIPICHRLWRKWLPVLLMLLLLLLLLLLLCWSLLAELPPWSASVRVADPATAAPTATAVRTVSVLQKLSAAVHAHA
jgi:hypothetical protein